MISSLTRSSKHRVKPVDFLHLIDPRQAQDLPPPIPGSDEDSMVPMIVNLAATNLHDS
jgi:hypothetical protein